MVPSVIGLKINIFALKQITGSKHENIEVTSYARFPKNYKENEQSTQYNFPFLKQEILHSDSLLKQLCIPKPKVVFI